MQTFDALPPASRTAPAHNSETTFNSEKPALAREKFDDVMDRALTGTSRESNGDENNLCSAERSPRQKATISNDIKPAPKPKKPLRREPFNDNTITEPAAMNIPAPHISRVAEKQSEPEAEGTSEDAPEAGAEKGKRAKAVGNSDQPAGTQSLALTGQLGAALPSTSAQVPGGGLVSKAAKGNASGKAGATDASAPPDPRSAQAEGPTAPGENATTGGDAPTTQPAGPPSDKADPAEIPAIPASDSQKTATTKANASVVNVSGPAADPGGTSAAKQYLTMKKAEKTPKVAGPAEQDLPSDAVNGSEELPTGQKFSAQALLHGSEKLESTITVEPPAARISTPAESATPVATAAIVSPDATADPRLRVLERTHDIVALHAMRLGQSGSESLHVVVKPGAGIHLSLELRQGEGAIEVRASLHQGDFEHLSQYWPELQQRLEARGVRVGALTCSENFSDTSHQQFQESKQHQSPHHDPLYAGAFAEFALAGSLREAPAARAARATAYRGWETWA